MEQPESPTPSDTPEAGAPTDLPPESADSTEQGATATEGEEDSPGAPNPGTESADKDGGASTSADLLNEMYLDLGRLVAAHDLRRADAARRLKELSGTAQDLQKQREEALASGDHMKYANAIRGLAEVAKIAELLQHDAEDDLRGSDQPEDADERGSGGSLDQREPGQSGDEQPLARPEDDREPERGPSGGDDGDVE